MYNNHLNKPFNSINNLIMKIIGIVLSTFILLLISNPSSAQTAEQKKMPPMEMLAKTGKSKKIYQLPKKYEYKVFNSKGKLYDKGEGEWIDMGKYKTGTYFIKYDDKTVSCEIKK